MRVGQRARVEVLARIELFQFSRVNPSQAKPEEEKEREFALAKLLRANEFRVKVPKVGH